MRRSLRLVIGLALFSGGVLAGLYGLFAFSTKGDCRGRDCAYVYVSVLGRETDANLVGAIALLIGLAAVTLSVRLLTHGESRGAGSV